MSLKYKIITTLKQYVRVYYIMYGKRLQAMFSNFLQMYTDVFKFPPGFDIEIFQKETKIIQ